MLILGAAIMVCSCNAYAMPSLITVDSCLHLAIVVILAGRCIPGILRSAMVDLAEQTIALADYGLRSRNPEFLCHRLLSDLQPRRYTSDISLTGYEQRNYYQTINVNNPAGW